MRLFEIENKTPSFKILSIQESREYKDLVEKYEDLPLYSGFNIHLPHHHPLQLVLSDSRNMKRESKTKDNNFNRILEELPSWQGYPKRSNSMFCTTKQGYAKNFGTKVFQVFPLEVPKFVISPYNDNQYSFRNLFDGPLRLTRIPLTFSKLLTSFFKALQIPDNPSVLRRIVELQKACQIDPKGSAQKIFDTDLGWFNHAVKEEVYNLISSDVNIISFLNDFLSPERNDFILTNDITKITKLPPSLRGNEIFFSGTALFRLIEDSAKNINNPYTET